MLYKLFLTIIFILVVVMSYHFYTNIRDNRAPIFIEGLVDKSIDSKAISKAESIFKNARYMPFGRIRPKELNASLEYINIEILNAIMTSQNQKPLSDKDISVFLSYGNGKKNLSKKDFAKFLEKGTKLVKSGDIAKVIRSSLDASDAINKKPVKILLKKKLVKSVGKVIRSSLDTSDAINKKPAKILLKKKLVKQSMKRHYKHLLNIGRYDWR